MIWSLFFLSVLNLSLFMWGAAAKSFSSGWTWVFLSCLKSGFKPILGLYGSKYSFKVFSLLLWCHIFHLHAHCLPFLSLALLFLVFFWSGAGYCGTIQPPRRLMWAYPMHLSSAHPSRSSSSIHHVCSYVSAHIWWHLWHTFLAVIQLLAGMFTSDDTGEMYNDFSFSS